MAQPEKIPMQCPFCGVRIRGNPNIIGHGVKCPKCGDKAFFKLIPKDKKVEAKKAVGVIAALAGKAVSAGAAVAEKGVKAVGQARDAHAEKKAEGERAAQHNLDNMILPAYPMTLCVESETTCNVDAPDGCREGLMREASAFGIIVYYGAGNDLQAVAKAGNWNRLQEVFEYWLEQAEWRERQDDWGDTEEATEAQAARLATMGYTTAQIQMLSKNEASVRITTGKLNTIANMGRKKAEALWKKTRIRGDNEDDVYDEDEDDIPTPKKSGQPSCQVCGGEMRKKTNATGGAFGCLLLLVGAALCFTVIGALIGVPMILLGLHYGMKRQAVWRCSGCKAEINRKLGMFEWG